MKIDGILKRVRRGSSIFISVMVTIGLMIFLPVTTVKAQDTDKPVVEPIQKVMDYPILEKAFQRAQSLLINLENATSKALENSDAVLKLIDKGNAAGLDTHALQLALSSFDSSTAAAQSLYEEAATLLRTHPGFDERGNVMDSATAKQTLRNCAKAMKSSGTTLRNASSVLKTEVSVWLKTHEAILVDRLSEGIQQADEWLSIQEKNIEKLKDATSKLAVYIGLAKGKGFDTTNLEIVLDDLNSLLPRSQARHAAAASILAAHSGFDDSADVTDKTVARKTLESARKDLDASRSINVSLANNLKAAIENWKKVYPKEILSIDIDNVNS